MTPAQYERIKKAALAFVERGGTLISGGWGIARTPDLGWQPRPRTDGIACACPMSALVLADPDTPRAGTPMEAAAALLGVVERRVYCFANGWDGKRIINTEFQRLRAMPDDVEWFWGGVNLRHELEAMNASILQDDPDAYRT